MDLTDTWPPRAKGSLWKKPPDVVLKKARDKAEDREWRLLCQRVDARDKKRCQVRGTVLSAGAVDPWQALERHHLEARSRNRQRKFDIVNLWTVSRAIHQLIHAGALRVLDKAGEPATDVRQIRRLEWNRTILPEGKEPFRLHAKWKAKR